MNFFEYFTTKSGIEMIVNPDRVYAGKVVSDILKNDGNCCFRNSECICKEVLETGTCSCELYVRKND